MSARPTINHQSLPTAMPSAPTADTLYLETDLDISQTLVIVETSSVEDGHDVCHALLIDGATVASNAAKCVISYYAGHANHQSLSSRTLPNAFCEHPTRFSLSLIPSHLR